MLKPTAFMENLLNSHPLEKMLQEANDCQLCSSSYFLLLYFKNQYFQFFVQTTRDNVWI